MPTVLLANPIGEKAARLVDSPRIVVMKDPPVTIAEINIQLTIAGRFLFVEEWQAAKTKSMIRLVVVNVVLVETGLEAGRGLEVEVAVEIGLVRVGSRYCPRPSPSPRPRPR